MSNEMLDIGYTDPAIVASQNAGRCPTCVGSGFGYCPMWQMGKSEPSCYLYERRLERTNG